MWWSAVRDRVDRRYALLLGLVLSLWAVTDDLALFPPDLSADRTPAAQVRGAPGPAGTGIPGPVRPARRAAPPGQGPGAAPPAGPASG